MKPRPALRASAQSQPAAQASGLSGPEQVVNAKYGPLGIQVYRLADGKKTGEEILLKTGISEKKLAGMLRFMDRKGIIKLENP